MDGGNIRRGGGGETRVGNDGDDSVIKCGGGNEDGDDVDKEFNFIPSSGSFG